MEQIPTIGRIVQYRLSGQDVDKINGLRTDAGYHGTSHTATGAQKHEGNQVSEGDTYPMLIVRTWGETPNANVNGQVFLDGNDVLWVTSVSVGSGPRSFSWPQRS